jgi:hypothetical protein
VWIQENSTLRVPIRRDKNVSTSAIQTTVVSLKTLENHFKNEKVKRVNWRHLSVDKMSVYRYSLPVVTTKFRLRVAHFLSRNYRCCILGIWCAVIVLISVGISLSVIFGSAPHSRPLNSSYYTDNNDRPSGMFAAVNSGRDGTTFQIQ